MMSNYLHKFRLDKKSAYVIGGLGLIGKEISKAYAMAGAIKGHVAGLQLKQDSNFIKQYSKTTPLKRMGNAEEIASVALFLASYAASYITGSTILVDGGKTAI